jgi:hypothetical protein
MNNKVKTQDPHMEKHPRLTKKEYVLKKEDAKHAMCEQSTYSLDPSVISLLLSV